MKKTLFVGFDAACWEYFDPLLESGRLPTIQKLLAKGSSGILESTLPAQTPTAWSSIITGKNPGKHGIYDFILKSPNKQDFIPADASLRLGTPFWNRLNERGVRVGLVNIPFNYPLESLDGFTVSGFGTPESVEGISYPAEAGDVIAEKFPGFRPVVKSSVLRQGSAEEIYIAERKHQQTFVEIALELSKRIKVDVLAINLLFPDHANHKMPDMVDVEKAICETDEDLQRLIQGFEPDNVMLFSDHGSRRVKGDFLLHAWLRDRGYCIQNYRTSTERSKAINWVIRQWLVDHDISGNREKVTRHLLGRVLSMLPDEADSSYWKQVNARVPFAYEQITLSEDIDPTQSPILLGSSYSGLLYVNEESKLINHNGAEKIFDDFISELSEQLLGITDLDTGEGLFSKVHESNSIYSGAASMLSPNLVIDIYDSPWNVLATFRRGYVGESVRGRYFSSNFRDYGHHSRNGLYIFSGQDFKEDFQGDQAHVMDLPATLIHLYNVPVPDDYDGLVMDHSINSEFITQHPISNQPGDEIDVQVMLDNYATDEPYTLDEHLKALGYLD
jgi:predicted AlkP superfamily phosphohydrolase/phosphomutase